MVDRGLSAGDWGGLEEPWRATPPVAEKGRIAGPADSASWERGLDRNSHREAKRHPHHSGDSSAERAVHFYPDDKASPSPFASYYQGAKFGPGPVREYRASTTTAATLWWSVRSIVDG